MLYGLLLLPTTASAHKTLLPRPAALRVAVQFWTRVYTQLDSTEGYVHDDRNLRVIYATLHFKPGSSPPEQERVIKRTLRRYRETLRRLAKGKHRKHDPLAHRIRTAWGKGAHGKTLRRAAARVRFQRGQADRFRSGLVRAGAWEEHIRATFRALGLPLALAALPHVESSYNPVVRSHAGAAGLWQITESAGKQFLRIDEVLDERLDPHRATEAAARFLQHNYEVLRSWPLAITAYNHGLSGVYRAVKATGSKDIGTIVRRYNGPRFGFASRNFYAAFLAALDVSSRPERYFKGLDKHAPEELRIVKLPAYFPVDELSSRLDVTEEDLKSLNPALGPVVWTKSKYVPKDYRLRLPSVSIAELARERLQRIAMIAGHTQQRPDIHYQVKPGDTLSEIAAHYESDISILMEMNELAGNAYIRAGQRLRLPPTPLP